MASRLPFPPLTTADDGLRPLRGWLFLIETVLDAIAVLVSQGTDIRSTAHLWTSGPLDFRGPTGHRGLVTRDFDEYYGATVGHGAKTGPRSYVALAAVFRRDTQAVVHRVSGEGATSNSAARRAMDAAKSWALSRPQPKDWNK